MEPFLDEAYAALLGSDSDPVSAEERDAQLFEHFGLGSSADGLAGVVQAAAESDLDPGTWPSIATLAAGDALKTIAAALFVIDPDFELRCDYLERLHEGWPRTVLELAVMVNRSHGYPVPGEEVAAAPFARKELAWEVASAHDAVLGDHPRPGGRDGAVSEPGTFVESPVVQLLAAFRGAHHAQWRRSPHAQVSDSGGNRPWAYRPFGRSQARLDLLTLLLGGPTTGAALAGPDGGRVEGQGRLGGVSLEVPAGAIDDEVVVFLVAPGSVPHFGDGQVPMGPAVDIQPSLVLAVPAILRMPFHPDLLPRYGAPTAEVDIHAFDESGQTWLALDTSVDGPGEVVAQLDHFSYYQPAIAAPADLRTRHILTRHPPLAPDFQDDNARVLLGAGGIPTYLPGGDLIWVERQGGMKVLDRALGVPPGDYPAPLLSGESMTVGVGGDRIAYAAYVTYRKMSTPPGQNEVRAGVWVGSLSSPGSWTQVLGFGDDIDGEGVPASEARFDRVGGLAFGRDGSLYVAGTSGGFLQAEWKVWVRRIAPDGTIHTVAGGDPGFGIADTVDPDVGCGNPEGPCLGTELKLAGQEVSVTSQTSSRLAQQGDVLFYADTRNARVRAIYVGPANKTATIGGVPLAGGQMMTVVGGTVSPSPTSPFSRLTCTDVLNNGTLGGSARDIAVGFPVGVSSHNGALAITDVCRNQVLLGITTSGPVGAELGMPISVYAGKEVGGFPLPNANDEEQATETAYPYPRWTSFDEESGALITTVALDPTDYGFSSFTLFETRLVDDDGDGVGNSTDSCSTAYNPATVDLNSDGILEQPDIDGDGLGDACDDDEDGDGIDDGLDNCPSVANTPQDDWDADGIGDACNLDTDGDGLADEIENLLGTDPNDCDTDNDGLCDATATCKPCKEGGTCDPACVDPASDPCGNDVDPCVLLGGEKPSGGDPRPPPPLWTTTFGLDLWQVSYDLPFRFRRESPHTGGACDGAVDIDQLRGTLSGYWGMLRTGNNFSPVRLDDGDGLPFAELKAAGASCKRFEEDDNNNCVEVSCVPRITDASVDVPLGLGDALLLRGGPADPLLDPSSREILFSFGVPRHETGDSMIRTVDGSKSELKWEDEAGLDGWLASTGSGILCRFGEAALFSLGLELFENGEPFVWQSNPTANAAVDCSGNELEAGAELRLERGTWLFDRYKIDSPKDIDGGNNRVPGVSQFTYSGAVDPGDTLEIPYRVVGPSALDADVAKRIRWQTPEVGSPTVAIDWGGDAWTGAVPSGIDQQLFGKGDMPTATYQALPPLLQQFGKKRMFLDYLDPDWETQNRPDPFRFVGTVEFEVFFEKTASNWPGSGGYEPNWYFYYERENPSTTIRSYVGPYSPAAFPECEMQSTAACWVYEPPADGAPFFTEIFVFEEASELQLRRFAAGVGAHENRHDTFFRNTMWGGADYDLSRDMDLDAAPQDWEEASGCEDQDPVTAPVRNADCWKASGAAEACLAHTDYCSARGDLVELDYADLGPNQPSEQEQECSTFQQCVDAEVF